MLCQPQLQQQLISSNQKLQYNVDSPMQIKLINFLGLKNFLINKFIFKRKPTSYLIRKQNAKTKLFIPFEYKPPVRYEFEVGILQNNNHSLPYAKLTPRNKRKDCFDTIIYAHGNSSDMWDGLKFMEQMALIYEAQYVVFDYNGYGQSTNSEVGQDVIQKDIEIVLGWVDKPLDKIILWGFSLGSYPVMSLASKYKVKGVILQCPIASVGCFFQQKLFAGIKFKQDYFANINLIGAIKSRIMIIHSNSDEIIPISHAQLLFNQYVRINGDEKICFIEVMNLKHNALHKYIVSTKINRLQKQVLLFLHQLKIGIEKKNENINNLEENEDLNEMLSCLKAKTKLGQIKEISFDQCNYELIEADQNIESKGEIKPMTINCFCLPNKDFEFQYSRNKDRSNQLLDIEKTAVQSRKTDWQSKQISMMNYQFEQFVLH